MQEEYALLQKVTDKDYKLTNRTKFLELFLKGGEQMGVIYPPRVTLKKEFDMIDDRTCLAAPALDSFFSNFTMVTYKRPQEANGMVAISTLNKWLDNGLR